MWKICTKCKKHKALWELTKSKSRSYGVGSWCKLCHSYHVNYVYDYSYKKNEWYINNKDSNKKRMRKNYLKNRDQILEEIRLKPASYIKYKDLLTIEESPRLNGKDNLEVKCRNCRKYFIPTNLAVYHRICALNELSGKESNLYCSEECKIFCPIFGRHSTTSISLREPIPKELRDEILSRNDGMCEMCGEHLSEEVHHEKPVSTHPHLQLDKDNLWGLCEYCHYEICHQLEGCTLPELRKKSVNNCSTSNYS
jgi:5-methylcytosine-specific restriction endonuclease McrA